MSPAPSACRFCSRPGHGVPLAFSMQPHDAGHASYRHHRGNTLGAYLQAQDFMLPFKPRTEAPSSHWRGCEGGEEVLLRESPASLHPHLPGAQQWSGWGGFILLQSAPQKANHSPRCVSCVGDRRLLRFVGRVSWIFITRTRSLSLSRTSL